MRKPQSPSELGFTDGDIARLSKAMQQVADKRTFIRLWTVCLVAQGYPISQVARLADRSFQIIYEWIATYLTHHQAEDLYDAPKTGRPLSAQQITAQCILRALRRNPWQLGFQ